MKKVIIVDDNKLCIEGICKNIDWNSMDAEVIATFTNVKAVLESIESIEPDLIISDINMPQMTGIDLAKHIIENMPYMKIIFISAYDDFKYAKEAIRLDVCDYVEKPVDYNYLSEVIIKVLSKSDQEKRILEQLKQSRPALTQKFLDDLLNTSPDYAEYYLADQAKYLNIDLSANEYVCTVIQINKFIEMINKFGVERYHILMISLSNELEQSFSKKYIFHFSVQGNQVNLILGNKQSKLDLLSSVYEDVSTFQEHYKNSPLSMTIGIGDIVTRIWDISMSYENAKHAIGYKFILGEGLIFNIQDIRRNNPSPAFFKLGDEEILINLISQKDLIKIKEFTDSLAIKWANQYYDKNGVMAYIYSIFARLIRFLYDLGIDDLQIRNNITEGFSSMDQLQTSSEICERLYEICVLSCKKLKESVETNHHQIAEQVINYIENNYMDIELSVNDIAANVKMSPSYLGAVFKKAKGQSISKIMTSIRINKAQELLKNTNLQVMEISDKVGYSNQYYFSACFKKLTGVTPTDYRSMNENLFK